MRSAVEEQLNLIALGRADFHAVLQHTVEIFKQKFHYFVQSIEAMDQLFEVSFSPLSASGKAHSRYILTIITTITTLHMVSFFLFTLYKFICTSFDCLLCITDAVNVVDI